MGRMKDTRPKKPPALVDRFELWLSTDKHVDGLWIGTYQSEPDHALRRGEKALELIKAFDRLRYNRLLCDLERVWVRIHPVALGNFNESLNACELDARFVRAETTSTEAIAATIVHEAVHARLMRCGITYGEELRTRVEAVCLRRELAFAAKLPNGEEVRESARRTLEFYADQSNWTSTVMNERYVSGSTDALHYVGVPSWLARIVLCLLKLRLPWFAIFAA